MMIGRAVGWMEWSGLVKGRAGDGDGDGDWEGEGRGEGEGSGNRSILDCSNMMTVLCVSWAKRWYFVKQNYRRFDEGQFTKVGGGARGKGRGVGTVPF